MTDYRKILMLRSRDAASVKWSGAKWHPERRRRRCMKQRINLACIHRTSSSICTEF